MLTARGVKPICTFKQEFKSSYLFGAFSPVDGEKFLLEMPFCNTESFQKYLDEFSVQNPEEYKIIILDNGAFHKSKKLLIPRNMHLVFLPPYSPELNPAERMWQEIKRGFTNKLFKTQDNVSEFISSTVKSITVNQVMNICRYSYIRSCDYWTM